MIEEMKKIQKGGNNIETIIKFIKRRPGMYIGEINFAYLVHFLNGNLFNDPSAWKEGTVSYHFKCEFSEWVKVWIEKNRKIQLEGQRNYQLYIQEVCKTQQECLDMFFELSEIFFQELHSK